MLTSISQSQEGLWKKQQGRKQRKGRIGKGANKSNTLQFPMLSLSLSFCLI